VWGFSEKKSWCMFFFLEEVPPRFQLDSKCSGLTFPKSPDFLDSHCELGAVKSNPYSSKDSELYGQ